MKDIMRRGLAMLMSVIMTLSLFVGYLPAEAFATEIEEVASDGYKPPDVADPNPDATVPPEPMIRITSDRANNTLEYIGDTLTLTATLENAVGVDMEKVIAEWSSSEPSAATVKNGVVTAQNFHPTADSLEKTVTITVTMKELSEGDAEEKVYTDSFDILVRYSIQPIFYYALIPKHSETATNGNGDSDWFGIGVELIAGAKPAEGASRDVGNLQYEPVGTRQDLYPEIDFEGKTYTHDSTTGNGYTLDRFRLVSDKNANGGYNKYNVYNWNTDPYWTYHVDHRLNFTEPGDYCNVHFMVKYPEAKEFTLDQESMLNVAKDTAESAITKPNLSSRFPDRTENGINYEFQGWYTDDKCSTKATFQGTITDNTWYYGRYVPTEAKYTIRFFYDGTQDENRIEERTGKIDAEILSSNEEIQALITQNTIAGYEFKMATPDSITLTAGGANEINVLYTKRDLAVSYHVEGKPTGVSDPTGASCKNGDSVTAAVMNVPGYIFSGWTTENIAGKTKVEPGTAFPMPGNDVTLNGILTPDPNTRYTVEHYQQNLNDGGYTQVSADTENRTGTTGETANAVAKNYPGFTLNPNATNARPSGTITGDGELVLRLYYDRVKNNITYQLEEGSNVPAGLDVNRLGDTGVKYGKEMTVAETAYEGYDFSGWSTSDLRKDKYDGGEEFTMPDHSVTFTGKFTAQPFEVEYVINGEDHSRNKDFPKTETKLFGETVTVAGAPACENGYGFIGWNTTDVPVDSNKQFQMPHNKVTLTGEFAPIDYGYTVNYYVGGTEEEYQTTEKVKDSDTKSAKFGDEIRLDPESLEKIEGYTLATKEEQRIEIGMNPSENVINIYYYKNVTVKAADDDKMFGEADPKFTAAVVEGDTIAKITFKEPLTREKGESAGKYKIIVTGEDIQGYYKVTYEPGTFTITANDKLRVAGKPYDVVYDGMAHGEEATVSGGPTTGVTVEYSTDDGKSWSKEVPTVTNVGTKTVKVKASAENYVTAENTYTLKVTPRTITLESEGGSKVYDGTPLANSTVTKTGEFANGEGGTWSATGSQTEKGSSKNTITYALNEGTNPGNYDIHTVEGVLEVTPRSLILTGNKGSATYDGKEHAVSGYTHNTIKPGTNSQGDGLIEGHVIEGLTYTAVGTDADTYRGGFDGSIVIKDKGVDVTENYATPVKELGELRIDPIQITVQSATNEKVYDGRALKDGNVTVILGDPNDAKVAQNTVTADTKDNAMVTLSNGETVVIEVTGSQREVGSSKNLGSVRWYGTAKESNYATPDFRPGTLTVKDSADQIVVTTTGGIFTYDGLPHGATVTVSELPEGYTLERAESDAVAQTVLDGTVDATCDELVIRNEEGKDVTSELNIRYANGKIVINRAPLYITTQSAAKEYDGEPLYAGVTVAGLVNDETVSVTAMGSQTEVGSSLNGYHVAWTGSAKVYNYEIVETLGTLTVVAEGEEPIPQVQDDDPPEVRVVETLLLEDEIVPLAGNTEKCCIMHFLLALAGLATVLISGHDTKKLQQKIAELKQEASPDDGKDGRKDDN